MQDLKALRVPVPISGPSHLSRPWGLGFKFTYA